MSDKLRCLAVLLLSITCVAAGCAISDTVSPDIAVRAEAGSDKPLWVIDVGVDGELVQWASLVRWRWGDLWSEPRGPQPHSGVVVSSDSQMTLHAPFASELTVTWLHFDESSSFVDSGTVAVVQAGGAIDLPGPGLWAADVIAEFGESPDDYPDSGLMSSIFWVQVVPAGATCVANGPSTLLVSPVVDGGGCPVGGDQFSFPLVELLPSFHCAPWPPRLEWSNHPTSEATAFMRYQFWDPRAPEVIALPADAAPSGFELLSGAIWTSPSDPDAVFIVQPGDRVERWRPPIEEAGCA